MEVFSEIRKEADTVLQKRFAEKDDSVKSATDELEGMTLLFLKLRRLNKKIQLECKENKTDLIKQEERISELKLCLNSMSYQAFKLNEDYTALSNMQRDLDPKLNLVSEDEFMRDESISEKPPRSDPVKVQEYNLKRLEYESNKRKYFTKSKEELSTKKMKLSTQKRGTSKSLAFIFKSFSDDFPAGTSTHDILNPFLDPCLDNFKNHLQAYAKVFGGYEVSVKSNPSTAVFSKGSVILSLKDETAVPSSTAVAAVNPFFRAEFRWVPSKEKVVLFEGKDSKVSLKDFCFAGLVTADVTDRRAVVETVENGVCLELGWVDELFVGDKMFSEAKVEVLNTLKSKWNAFYDLKKQIEVFSKLKLPPELKKYSVLLSSWRTVSLSLEDSVLFKTHFKRGHFNVEGTVKITKEFPEVPPHWEFLESQTLKKAGISLGGLKSEVNTRFFGKVGENVLLKQVALISEVLSSIYDGLSGGQESVVGRDRRPSTIITE